MTWDPYGSLALNGKPAVQVSSLECKTQSLEVNVIECDRWSVSCGLNDEKVTIEPCCHVPLCVYDARIVPVYLVTGLSRHALPGSHFSGSPVSLVAGTHTPCFLETLARASIIYHTGRWQISVLMLKHQSLAWPPADWIIQGRGCAVNTEVPVLPTPPPKAMQRKCHFALTVVSQRLLCYHTSVIATQLLLGWGSHLSDVVLPCYQSNQGSAMISIHPSSVSHINVERTFKAFGCVMCGCICERNWWGWWFLILYHIADTLQM